LPRVKSNEKRQRGCRREEEEIGERRRRGVHWQGRNRRIMPTVSAGFGERFRQPCGDAGGKSEGEGRGECGLYIGTGWGRNGRALTRIEEEKLRGRKRSPAYSTAGG
jgi:hypothetical protein